MPDVPPEPDDPAIPVVDVAALVARGPDAAERAAAAAIDRACRTTGFFLVSGHGVDPSLLESLDAAARDFFARPATEKAAVAMERGGRAWRGWFPEGGELTSGRPDHKEGLYYGEDLPGDDPRVLAGLPLHGPNLHPVEPAALRPAVDAWMAAMTRLGHALVRGVALGLGLDAGWFDEHLTAHPTVLFRIFRYPPRPAGDDGWGVGEHTDYGLLTILAHDGSPGLQVRSGDRWLDVPAVPGTFVVNLGDMLDRMTGGRYRSTPHRVRHVAPDPDAGTGTDTGTAGVIGTAGAEGERPRDRLSFPFFFDPGWDVEIRPVPLGDDAPPDDASTRWDAASVHHWHGTYGDYLTAKVAKVFPGLGAEVL